MSSTLTRKQALEILWTKFYKEASECPMGDIGESFDFTYSKRTDAELIEEARKVQLSAVS